MKWAIVGQKYLAICTGGILFSNKRTDNSVKNKFYSKYRRAIRNLNHLLNHSRNIKLKELKINFVYKVINFLEKKCESDSRHQIELVKMAKCTPQHIQLLKMRL